MKKINEIVTLSGAIAAMCRGLRKQDANESFEINMYTYGKATEDLEDQIKTASSGEQICYGCAATATIMEVGNKQLTHKEISECITRAKALDFQVDDLDSFEYSINDFRLGYSGALLDYFQVEELSEDLDISLKKLSGYPLHKETWRENLRHYEELVPTLQKLGY